MEIQAVEIASIIYDEEFQNLINLRNRGAMIGDPSIREGHVQTTIAGELKSAGSSDSGAMAGSMDMGMGMQIGGGFMGVASNANTQQTQMNQASVNQPMGDQPPDSQWAAPNQMAGAQPGGGGMTDQMSGTQPSGVWLCPGCGTSNIGKFCDECGHRRPDAPWTCACGNTNTGRFCSECGKPRP